MSSTIVRQATNRLSSTTPPAHRSRAVMLGITVIVVIAAAVIVSVASAPPVALVSAGAVVAVSAFLFGRAADGPRPHRWAIAGALIAASAASLQLVPGWHVAALLLAACAAFGLAAASALLITGIPPKGAPWTPRYRLPVPLAIPARRRRALRHLIAVATAAGAVIALAPLLDATFGEPFGAVAAGLGFLALVVAAVASVRLARPLQEAETTGAVLASGGGALLGVGSVTLLVLVFAPAAVATAAWAIVSVVAVGIARPRRHRPARLSRPGSRAYRVAVSGYELNTKLTPAAAGVARSVADVVGLVGEARRLGLGVRTHSTGHRASIVPPMDDEALIRVLLDEPVTADPVTRTARVPAGAKWADVLDAIVPYGLGAPHGSSGDVGVVGYLLRGGLSFYGRGRGVGANSVIRIELVDATGAVRTVDADHDPDLFWALRGGGGGFGIVTALTIRLFPLGEIATGTLIFDSSRAHEVARAWHDWALDAPAEITTSLRIAEVPKLPGVPRRLGGRTAVIIDGIAHRLGDASADPSAAAESLITALREVAEPEFDSWRLTTPYEAPYTHMDLPVGLHHAADHLMLRDPGVDGIAAFVDAAIESGILCELRQLGGALAHRPVDAGAVGLYSGAFAYFAGRLGPSDEDTRTTLDRLRAVLSPWDVGVVVPTFAADPSRPQRLFGDDVAERVRSIRRQVDPNGVFAGDVVPDA